MDERWITLIADGRRGASAVFRAANQRGRPYHGRVGVSPLGDDGTWQRPRWLSSWRLNAADLVVDANRRGDAVVAWRSAKRVRVAVRTAGGRFSRPIALGTRVISPEIGAAIGSAGDVTVTWKQFDGQSSELRAAYRSIGGTFEEASLGPMPMGAFNPQPLTAVSADGVGVVARSASPDQPGLIFSRTREHGFGTPEALPQAATGIPLAVAFDQTNTLTLVLSEPPSVVLGAQPWTFPLSVLSRRPSEGWTDPGKLSEGFSASLPPAAIALADDGAGAIVWSGASVTRGIVRRPDGSLETPPATLGVGGNPTYPPAVAVDPRGRPIVAWHDGPRVLLTRPPRDVRQHDPALAPRASPR